jgi:hypothetical protein
MARIRPAAVPAPAELETLGSLLLTVLGEGARQRADGGK